MIVALANALSNRGGPSNKVRNIRGMSGQKYRCFINILIKSLPNSRYLEIGSHKGSTVAAALCGTDAAATCIDNWCDFDCSKQVFVETLQSAGINTDNINIIEDDFRNVNYNTIGKHNIYLYDGPHEIEDQYDGILLALPALADFSILIVDDWNSRDVRIGTFKAIRRAGLLISLSVEIRTTLNNNFPEIVDETSEWHNGYFIAVVSTRGRSK